VLAGRGAGDGRDAAIGGEGIDRSGAAVVPEGVRAAGAGLVDRREASLAEEGGVVGGVGEGGKVLFGGTASL